MKTSAVILAAGAGVRLGGVAKALLVGKDGRSFLQTIVATAGEVGVERAIVVVGPPFGGEVRSAAEQLGAKVVANPDPTRGMASSVALGFAALAHGDDAALAGVNAAWLWPVDHPDVSATTLRSLISALLDHEAARPVFQRRGGHPPLIAKSLFARLAACAEVEGGARSVLAAADTIAVPVDDPGCVRDVDTVLEREER